MAFFVMYGIDLGGNFAILARYPIHSFAAHSLTHSLSLFRSLSHISLSINNNTGLLTSLLLLTS